MKEKLLLTLFAISLIIGIPVIFLGISIPEYPFIALTLTTIIQIITAYFIIKESLKDYNIDLLFLLSTTSAYMLSIYGLLIGEKSYFHVTAILIIVYYITKLIDYKTQKNVKKTFSDLYKLLPKNVRIIRNGKERTISIKNLTIGDVVIISSGNNIPVDGAILSGSSFVDESLITGESQRVEKNKGDKVIAGTIVVDGLIGIKVERIGKDTYLSQIIDLIKNVEESKLKNKEKIKNPYKIFMTFLILASLIIFFVYNFFGYSYYQSFERMTTILVISSNASLVLATPIAIIFAIITLTKKGIVVKNHRSIEMIPEIKTFIFDKTGTLTEGKVKVNDVIALNNFSREEIIKYFLMAEKNSSHTLVKRLYKQLKKNKRAPEPDSFKEYFGIGVYAKYKDDSVYVGEKKLLKKFNIATDELPKDLQNTIVICVNKKIIGLIKFQDTLKESSKELVEFLKERKSEVIMLTGDNKKTARDIGRELGITKIFSEITPEKKLEIIRKLREKNRLVMIGDGINDTPSLAQADVGISVNNEVDLIKESSDIILVRNDLGLIQDLVKVSDYTKTKIKQNLFWTYSYNFIAVLIASGLFARLGLSADPLIACAASISSTISIMINSFLFR